MAYELQERILKDVLGVDDAAQHRTAESEDAGTMLLEQPQHFGLGPGVRGSSRIDLAVSVDQRHTGCPQASPLWHDSDHPNDPNEWNGPNALYA
jgi:hypothetical protein